ncbi:MAG: preprotein translocase subunit YajC [Defluviitaleaceae bacterium]|nr:preprotein translocase subunit YajC [Defluviitaleaceae bacterium]
MTDALMIFFERAMILGYDLGLPAPGGGAGGGATGDVAQAASDAANGAASAANEPASMMPMLIIWGVAFAGFWFLVMRPQRKREKKMKELQSAITTGDNIITSGGLFGKVADIGEDCFIVEFGTNRGIRIPVLKADVVSVRSPKMTPQVKDAE